MDSRNRGSNYHRHHNKQYNRFHNRGRNNSSHSSIVMEAHAPYNFVPFPEQIITRYEVKEDLPKHCGNNSESDKLLSGEIEFEIIAQSPILVADGTGRNDKRNTRQFVRNADGVYEIPGSTLRGLIRQTVSILSLSNWTSRIDDETFYYRALADKNHGRREYKDTLDIKTEIVRGNRVTIARNVKAGYIVKVGKDEYVIYPAKVDGGRQGKSYYKCHQRNFPQLKKDIAEGFKCRDVRFSVDEHGKVVHLGRDNASFQGKLLFSGPMRGKKTAYVINEIDADDSKAIAVQPRDLKIYQADYTFRCTKFGRNEKQKEYFKLPEKIGLEHAKPCFYIYLNNRLYFGFTSYLRLPYTYSTKDALPRHLQQDYSGIDYEQALFGFTNLGEKNENYASRLSFLHAPIHGKQHVIEVKESVVLGQPRASALGMYLKQQVNRGITHTYNNEKAELRGLKQYWLKSSSANHQTRIRNENLASILHLLPKETKFRGRIRFDQLNDDELGLLLWALQGPVYHQIGMGKPYGYGLVQFANFRLKIIETERGYNLLNFFAEDVKEESSEQFIHQYKSYVRERFGIHIEEQESIRTFFAMKEMSPLPAEKMKYMDLNQYRNSPVLPSVKSLLDNNM